MHVTQESNESRLFNRETSLDKIVISVRFFKYTYDGLVIAKFKLRAKTFFFFGNLSHIIGSQEKYKYYVYKRGLSLSPNVFK